MVGWNSWQRVIIIIIILIILIIVVILIIIIIIIKIAKGMCIPFYIVGPRLGNRTATRFSKC